LKLAAMRNQMEEAIVQRDNKLQHGFKEEIDTLQQKIRRIEEQQKLTQTLKEVGKRKEEEFRAFLNR
jgi:hypothetical protein